MVAYMLRTTSRKRPFLLDFGNATSHPLGSTNIT